MADRRGDSLMWLLGLGLVLGLMGGPVAVTEYRESRLFRVFVWFLTRALWFGAGALTVYLCMK